MGNFYEQVYAVVRRIPQGKVTSYGRIAQMLGQPRAARAVGYALNALKDKDEKYADVPWQRVINNQGRISIVNRENSASHQAELLRKEGVVVDENLRVNLDVYLWEGLHWVEIDDILGS
ncbi:MAG: MGMT family protein [Ardenticatenaceae bacterium]|nr:MGMT family protein [Ardenticatenaceae bacterium]